MNNLAASGAVSENPTKYAPLVVNQIFTGYWPNGNPLRDRAVPFLYQKFYQASRNEGLLDGNNTEVTTRMTLGRRFGNPVFNSVSFPQTFGFYAFKPFVAGTGEEVIVISDSTFSVFNATPNSQVRLWSKSTGSGRTRFRGVENTLFSGNGVDTLKWSWFPARQNTTVYAPGACILDSNNNIQQTLGYGVSITSTSVTSNIATITYGGSGTVAVGDIVTFYGLTTATGLNNATVTVLTISSGVFTCAFNTSNYSTTSDTGVVVDNTKSSGGTSGSGSPSFSGVWGSVLLDGTVVWISWGNSVQNMGIVAPTAAPTVQTVSVPSSAVWAASTYYFPTPLIFDSGTTSIQQLTTSGTTASSVPTFSGTAGTTTTDGTAVWTSKGTATRGTNTTYTVGAFILVSWTFTYFTYEVVCFGGNTEVRTPAGYVPFAELPEKFWIINETGKHLAELEVNKNYDGEMIEYAPGKLVTPQHCMLRKGEWVPASEFYSDKPRVSHKGTVYNLHVITEKEEDRHYVIETGDIAHNFIAPPEGDGGCTRVISTPHNLTYASFFQCTTGGVSSSTATSALAWNAALDGTTTDGTVTWTNVGREVTRSTGTASPTGGGSTNMVSGTVGNSLLVSKNTIIQDSNLAGESPILAGESGGSHPTWATTLNAQTIDNSGLTWSNQGPLGSANTGNWFYAFSYGNSATGDESTASPLSSPILLPAGDGVTVTGPGSPDLQVTQINIYRSMQTASASVTVPSVMGLLTSIIAPFGGQSWSFTDTTPDPPNPGAVLNVLITPSGYATNAAGIIDNFNDPPPAGLTNMELHIGRLWGSVGNILYFSTGPDVTVGNGTTAWDVENFFEVSGTIFRLWPTTVGLYIFTNDGTWIITGLGTSSSPFSEAQLVDGGTSINNYDAFSFNANQALAYLTDSVFCAIDATNGSSDLGQPIGNILAASYSPSEAYVTFHRHGYDQRGFITNGSNTWLNFMAAPSPETGFIWSPPANLVNAGGVQAVQSIETEPGVFSLLIGPGAADTSSFPTWNISTAYVIGNGVIHSGIAWIAVLDSTGVVPSTNSDAWSQEIAVGPILQRDSNGTTFSDGGTAYESFAVFGNLVLAHPGQMALVAFMTIKAVKVGSEPKISVLLDELYGQANTPVFAVLQNPVLEPPRLAESTTLYSLRYWFISTQEPCWCQHMVWKIDFGTDTVANELLEFGVFGKWVSEKA
jgi:hypothetical protein